MRAVEIVAPGDVVFHDVSIPLPGRRQVLIRVQSCSLNRVDLGHIPENVLRKHRKSIIGGIEIVGTIAAFGEECGEEYDLGDQVFCLVTEGGLAEFAVAEYDMLIPSLPEVSTYVMNAIPVAFITAYHICFIAGRLQEGDVVVVHAAASSVGLAITQLLTRKNVVVIATIRNESKRHLVEDAGATEVVVLNSDLKQLADDVTFRDLIRAQSKYESVDAVLDCIGEEMLMDNIDIVKYGGRIIIYGMMGINNSKMHSDILGRLMEKDVSLSTANVLAQSLQHKGYIIRCLKREFALFGNIVEGNIKIFLDRVFDLCDIQKAVDRQRWNEHEGKIIILISSVGSAIEELQRELISIERRNNWKVGGQVGNK